MSGDAALHPDSAKTDDELLAVLARWRAEGKPAAGERRACRAFEILFERYHRKVHAWCGRVLGDADRAAEVTQSVFLDLWNEELPYAERRRFASWLYVLSRNRCLNLAKREARFAPADAHELLEEAIAPDANPQQDAERAESRRAVREACRRALTEREHEVIYLRHHWGLSVDAITKTLGLDNASGARTFLRTAEKKLRRALEGLRE